MARTPVIEHDAIGDRATYVGIVTRSAVAAGLVTLLYGSGYLGGLQASWAGALNRAFPLTPTSHVVFVAITEADYALPDLFAGVSPLDPGVLQRLFERLAAHRPAAVAVDILLHPPVYETPGRNAQRRNLYATISRLAADGPTHWILVDPGKQPSSNDEATRLSWDTFRDTGSAPHERLTWASADLTAEGGLIRRIGSCVTARRSTVLGALIAAADPAAGCSPGHDGGSQPLRYSGAFSQSSGRAGAGRRFSVGEIIDPPAAPTGPSILTGKTLIVGAAYPETLDTHWTPLGPMYGAEVWAEAMDSWWRRDSVYEPSWPLVFILQATIGIATGWLTLHLRPAWGHPVLILGFGGLAAFFTWLSIGVGFAVASSLPSFFAAQFHVRVAALPDAVADIVQRRVERRRQSRRNAPCGRRMIGEARTAHEVTTDEPNCRSADWKIARRKPM